MNVGENLFSTGGFFNNAHHFTIYQPTMIDGTSANETRGWSHSEHVKRLWADFPSAREALDSLMNNSIPGTEYDASERYPPPSCHPETRLDICGHIRSWLYDPSREKNMLWLHGAAGVGKSAIMQTLAESEAQSLQAVFGAGIFFSRRDGRNDTHRVCVTIAYQLATKFPSYRKYVVDMLSADPRLIGKSMTEQFRLFLVKPFTEKNLLAGTRETLLILLDGLDECDGEASTRELILLIGRFVRQNPATPLIWVVASRPEPHIKSAFSHPHVHTNHIDIEVPINSSQSCADVERYLRDRFAEIRQAYAPLFSPIPQVWPVESDFLLIAATACGLFIFASTIIRFIEDELYGNPVSRLQTVLCAIRAIPLPERQCNPFAVLDSLYTEILSSIPSQVLPRTMNLLSFALVRYAPFGVACNWLGLTQADAYSALRKLQSILSIPPPEMIPHNAHLEVFHMSFLDYLLSPSRSGQFSINDTKAWENLFQAISRVFLESYRPGEDISVQVSRIKISWLYHQEELHVQKEIFEMSLRWFFLFGSEVRDMEGHLCDQLADFFDNLDYGALSPLLPQASDAGRICYFICTSTFFHVLQNRKLVHKTGLQALDLNRLRPSNFASGQLLKKYRCDSTKLQLHEPALLLEGFEEVGGPTCNDPYWKSHLLRHLFIMMNISPPPDIFLIGRGGKSCVLILKSRDDYLWHYLLPYDQS